MGISKIKAFERIYFVSVVCGIGLLMYVIGSFFDNQIIKTICNVQGILVVSVAAAAVLAFRPSHIRMAAAGALLTQATYLICQFASEMDYFLPATIIVNCLLVGTHAKLCMTSPKYGLNWRSFAQREPEILLSLCASSAAVTSTVYVSMIYITFLGIAWVLGLVLMIAISTLIVALIQLVATTVTVMGVIGWCVRKY